MPDPITTAVATGAAGVTFWQVLCGDAPVPKALAGLVDAVKDQFGQGMQSANDWFRGRALASGRAAEAEAAIAVQKLNARADHESKLFKMQSQEERAAVWQDIQRNRRQRQLEQVLNKTADELRGTPDREFAGGKVDPDWTTRFFEHAQDVSDEDMQRLLAKLLAGEVKRPGSFRPRTLDAVKALSRDEAETFTKLCSVAWHDCDGKTLWSLTDPAWVHTKSEGKPAPIPFDYSDCLLMAECGLIDVSGTFKTMWGTPSGFFLSYFGEGYIFSKPAATEPRVQFNLGTFHWTAVGAELARVVEGCRDDEYLQAILSHHRTGGWDIAPGQIVGDKAVKSFTLLIRQPKPRQESGKVDVTTQG